jgi:asparagine synthase (glutamine-hydrolysing)
MGRSDEVYPQTRWGKLADVLATRGSLLPLYQVSYGLFSRRFREELSLHRVAGAEWGLDDEELSELDSLIRDEPRLHAISLLELTSFLRERLLRDTDAASMAVSLEVRVPLLDHAFVEAVAGLPENVRFRPIRRKHFLRNLIRDQIDPASFDRPKAGFELPFELWCRRRLSARIEDTFEDINLAHRCGLNAEAVGRLWRAFKRQSPGIYWSRIWGLFVFMTWCKRHGMYA